MSDKSRTFDVPREQRLSRQIQNFRSKRSQIFQVCKPVRMTQTTHDLCLLRLYQACPSRSGEVRQLEFIDWETLDDLRGRKVLSRYVLDSHRNILTRRPLSCFSMHIGSSKTTKHMGVSLTEFQEVCVLILIDLDFDSILSSNCPCSGGTLFTC